MKLYHIPPECPCQCHRGKKIFEYLDCCPYIGEQWGKEWDRKKSVKLMKYDKLNYEKERD